MVTAGRRPDVVDVAGTRGCLVGALHLHRDKLPVENVLLVLYYADQGSPSDEKLRLLASMAQTPAGDGSPMAESTAHAAEAG